MAKLHDLQESRARAVSEMQSLNDKVETETRDYSDVEDKRHKELKADVVGLDRQIQRAADLQEATRSAPAILHHGRGDGNFEDRCRNYSLIRAIASQSGMAVDAGNEKEISQELQRRSGMAAEGILAPTNIFEKRVVTTALPVGGPGSNIIPTDYMAGQYIDQLRDGLATARLGARVLSNLHGNVAIPRLTVGAIGYWVAENAPVTVSDPEHDQLTLSGKHVGARVEVSRNMLQQSSPDIETLLRDDMAKLLAGAIDKGALIGGGAGEPVGVLSTVGIGDVAGGANGLAPTYANIVALITMIAGNNALAGNLGFVGNSKFAGKASSVLKSAADTSSNFIMSPGDQTLVGYKYVMTRSGAVESR